MSRMWRGWRRRRQKKMEMVGRQDEHRNRGVGGKE